MNRISIAMCTFNGEAFLAEQLESIRAQSRPPNELVICDDGSTDNSAALVRNFASTVSFPVHWVVNAHRLGPTKNFERAISLTIGDVIVLCDQDDVWRADKLARIATVFEESDIRTAGVFSDAELIDADGAQIGSRLWQYFGFGNGSQKRVLEGNAFEVLLRKHVVPGCSMAFRASYKALLLPFPEVGIHDRWIAILLAAVAEFALIPEPLIRYRRHGGQHSGAALASVAVAIRKNRVKEQLSIARRPAGNVYAEHAALYEHVLARLSASDGFHMEPARLRQLSEKVTHVRARSLLPAPRWQRIPAVAVELFRGRYRRYSNGIYSVAKDLISAGVDHSSA
jgi:glycosyltransferase involved in cell wall biosynthesis